MIGTASRFLEIRHLKLQIAIAVLFGSGAVVLWLYLMYRAACGHWYQLSLLGWWAERNPQFAVRTTGNPTAFTQPVRDRIWQLDPNLPIARVQTMREYVDQSMAQKSFAMVLLLVGAGGALLIGAVGIYGVISYVVSQQTREIGVRMAMGARSADIGRMVLGRSMLITGIGVVFGVAGALSLTGVMESLLFGVSPVDPLTFGAVIVTLVGVAALAAYLPAQRASRVDPLEALRQE